MRSSKSTRTTSTKKANLPDVLLPTLWLDGAFPSSLPEKHGAPTSCSLKGCWVEAVSQISRRHRCWCRQACRGASGVPWPGAQYAWMARHEGHHTWASLYSSAEIVAGGVWV